MAISVNELADGRAESIINNVSKELKTSRNSLCFELHTKSTGHCSSTLEQKIYNLIEEQKLVDW